MMVYLLDVAEFTISMMHKTAKFVNMLALGFGVLLIPAHTVFKCHTRTTKNI